MGEGLIVGVGLGIGVVVAVSVAVDEFTEKARAIAVGFSENAHSAPKARIISMHRAIATISREGVPFESFITCAAVRISPTAPPGSAVYPH
jgi:hypothetical protein